MLFVFRRRTAAFSDAIAGDKRPQLGVEFYSVDEVECTFGVIFQKIRENEMVEILGDRLQ